MPADCHVHTAGNPCKIIRVITEEDKPCYYKDRTFDDEVWDIINGQKKGK